MRYEAQGTGNLCKLFVDFSEGEIEQLFLLYKKLYTGLERVEKLCGGIRLTMKKVRKRKVFLVIGVLLVLIGMILIWFHIPYSPVKRDFQKDIDTLMSENQLRINNEVFTKEDFSSLPVTIQKYIQGCGYIGTPKMSYLKMEYKDVDFSQGRPRPTLTIDYTQYNFVNEPCRMALIDSSMFGIPFEGYDYCQNGAGGIFTFNEQYEMVSFTTKDRAVTRTDGSMAYVPWSALCGDYQVPVNGIKYPSKFQAVWEYPDEDLVYFDGVISEVSYGYAQ